MTAPGSPRLLPGAEAFRFDRGSLGMLLVHGFTGAPASMRPMGEWMAERGVSIVGPRLPGHGTVWQDLSRVSSEDWIEELERALSDLSSRCSDLVAVGHSFGGSLVMQLALAHPDAFRGVVVINPYVRDARIVAAPVVRVLVPSVKGVVNDIKKPGQVEIRYERIPVRALGSVAKVHRRVRRALPSFRIPLLVFSSPEDHTVNPSNARVVMDRVGSERKELVILPNSYHVAQLDFDAETVFTRTLAFANAVTGRPSEASA